MAPYGLLNLLRQLWPGSWTHSAIATGAGRNLDSCFLTRKAGSSPQFRQWLSRGRKFGFAFVGLWRRGCLNREDSKNPCWHHRETICALSAARPKGGYNSGKRAQILQSGACVHVFARWSGQRPNTCIHAAHQTCDAPHRKSHSNAMGLRWLKLLAFTLLWPYLLHRPLV